MTPRIAKWTVQPDGSLDASTINRIDEIAVEFGDVVHGEGSVVDIARLTRGMGRVHLIALAIAVASLDGPDIVGVPIYSQRWTEQALRDSHALYQRGDRHPRVLEGERLYQRLRGRKRREAARAS